MAALRQENAELCRANEILKTASALFAAAEVGPPTAVIVEYIDAHRDRFGVDPICTVLTERGVPIAPCTNCIWLIGGSTGSASSRVR